MFKKIFASILGLLPLALSGCYGNVIMPDYKNSDKYLVGSQSYESPLNDINIEWMFGTITLVEDPDIRFAKIEEENDLQDKFKVHSYCSGNVLDIKFMAPKTSASIENTDKNLKVTYYPGLLNLNIKLTSGEIVAEKLSADKAINIKLTSGKISVDEMKSHEINVTYTSGNVDISKIDSDRFNCTYTSGNFMGKFTSRVKNSALKFTSGKSIISLSEDGGVVKVDKTSGSVTTHREGTEDHGKYTFGSGNAEFSVKFTSGSLDIY